MKSLTIEPHYLGSIEYFTLLSQYHKVELEVCDAFQKQTYRNRTYFLGSNKIHALVVPTSFRAGTATKDVKVDHNQRWVKDHWGAFYSYYGKAPYFEFFSDYFHAIWNKKYDFLVDLSSDFIHLILKILGYEIALSTTTEQVVQPEDDYRNRILPKESFSRRKIYQPASYIQLFGTTFAPNLSIVDLIMSEGTESTKILEASKFHG